MFPTELNALRTSYQNLPENDQEFARSLLAQYNRRSTLSPKQWPWVKTLAERAAAAVTPSVAASPAGEPAAVSAPARKNVGDLATLRAMFAKAGEHLKFPHIMLRLDNATTLKVWVAGARARNPGSLTVINEGDRRRIGTVHTDGTWEPGFAVSAEVADRAFALLTELAEAPKEVLARHGKQLGACCYCRLELSDERSLAVGYGATCAKNWGLPYPSRKDVRRGQLTCDDGADLLAQAA